MAIAWPRFSEIVHAHQRFLLTSHIRPDCDALGSELGMAGILDALGKDVSIVNGHPTPPNLAAIDPQRRILALGQDVQPEQLADAQVIMILDTSAWAQLGPMGDVIRASQAKKIIVDHHVSADELDAEPFKDTQAEATGTLVLQAAKQLGVPLTTEIANALFAAIATDTGWFRFPSTSADTYRDAAELLEAGVRPESIYNQLYEQDTVGRVRLRGVILARVNSELDGRLTHTYVLNEDFEHTGALPSDTEDVINMTLAIAGTEFAVIFVQQATGGFKLSFRSRCAVQCNQIAEHFGGGGHKAAAGAFVDGELDQVRSSVLEVVRDAMHKAAG
jgi:bifunctional oligoribonuclease and PAP phosphatase NrnA